MNLLTLFILLAAAIVNLYYVIGYVVGSQLSTWLGRTVPAPDDVSNRLSFGSPPILVIQVSTNIRSASTGPPWSRPVLVAENILDDDELTSHVASAVAKFETNAYDVIIFTHLLRLDLLFGIMVVLSLSAQDQLSRSILFIGPVIAGGFLGVYLLHRISAWRVGMADEQAAARVGHDGVVSVLESAPDPPLPWVPDILRPQPRPKHRLETLEAREDRLAA